MNSFFATIGKKLADKIPVSNINFRDYLTNVHQSESFFFTPVTIKEIEHEINLIPKNKAFGLYSTPVSFLQVSRHVIS